MEDGLVPFRLQKSGNDGEVLILVVVDDGLVLKVQYTFGTIKKCLNPCCSGQWSRTAAAHVTNEAIRSLNPCCSGQWSRTGQIL